MTMTAIERGDEELGFYLLDQENWEHGIVCSICHLRCPVMKCDKSFQHLGKYNARRCRIVPVAPVYRLLLDHYCKYHYNIRKEHNSTQNHASE